MKLYHMPPTRSDRARWALEEIGSEHELEIVDLRQNAQAEPEYRAIHPLGFLPSLELDDGKTVRESAAVVMYLAERNPDAQLAPELGDPKRGSYLEWCVFGPAELDFNLVAITQNTMILPEDKRNATAAEAGKRLLSTRLEHVANSVEDDGFLLGEKFSAADIVVGHSVVWSSWFGFDEQIPKLGEYLNRLKSRTAFQAVYNSG